MTCDDVFGRTREWKQTTARQFICIKPDVLDCYNGATIHIAVAEFQIWCRYEFVVAPILNQVAIMR